MSKTTLTVVLVLALLAVHATCHVRERQGGPRRRLRARPSDGSHSMGLNVKDYGATGNGDTDDAAAFQKAIDAAQTEHRTLLVPAGQYRVDATLQVSNDAPLRVQGEGKYNTEVFAGMDKMFAVFNFSGVLMKCGTNHELTQFGIAAESRASYAIYAPWVTRSYFRNLAVSGGLKAGILHGGWINVIDSCAFNGNGVAALELTNDSNNVIVSDCSMEGNTNVAVLITGGAQITLNNNVIEGNEGPAIIASAVWSLALRSNYYEENCITPYTFAKNNITVYADVVITGSSDALNWLAGAYPCKGLDISGEFFSPHPNRIKDHFQAAIVLAGVDGATIANNDMYNNGKMSFVLSAVHDTWVAKNVRMRDNVGTGGTTAPTGVRIVDPTRVFSSTWLHSWSIDSLVADIGTRTLGVSGTLSANDLTVVRHNGNRVEVDTFARTAPPPYFTSVARCMATRNGTTDFMGRVVYVGEAASRFAGVPVWVAAWVKVVSNDTVVSLNIDDGTTMRMGSDWYTSPSAGWVLMRFATVLQPKPDTDSFTFSYSMSCKTAPPEAFIAGFALGLVGAPYDALFA